MAAAGTEEVVAAEEVVEAAVVEEVTALRASEGAAVATAEGC